RRSSVTEPLRLDESRLREMRQHPSPRFPGPIGRPRKSPADRSRSESAPADRRGPGGLPHGLSLRDTPSPPRLLDATEAAAYLGVHPRSIRRMVAEGALRRVRMPCAQRRFLVDRADLDRLVDASKT